MKKILIAFLSLIIIAPAMSVEWGSVDDACALFSTNNGDGVKLLRKAIGEFLVNKYCPGGKGTARCNELRMTPVIKCRDGKTQPDITSHEAFVFCGAAGRGFIESPNPNYEYMVYHIDSTGSFAGSKENCYTKDNSQVIAVKTPTPTAPTYENPDRIHRGGGDGENAGEVRSTPTEVDTELTCENINEIRAQQSNKNSYSRYGSVRDAINKNKKTTSVEYRQGLGNVKVYFTPNNGTKQMIFETCGYTGVFGVWRREKTPGIVTFEKAGYKVQHVDIDKWPSDGIIWLEKEDSTPQKSSTTNETAKVTSEKPTTGQTRPATNTVTNNNSSTVQSNSNASNIRIKDYKNPVAVHVQDANQEPINGAIVYYLSKENETDFTESKDLKNYKICTTTRQGTCTFYVKEYTGVVAARLGNSTVGLTTKDYLKLDKTVTITIDNTTKSATTKSASAPAGTANSVASNVNASIQKTDDLQTPIRVQVLDANGANMQPVPNAMVYYTPDTNDMTFLNNPSNSKYHINGNAQTGSDGKVTIYTKNRTGLIATMFGNKEFIVPVEHDEWRTTRIIITK